MTNSHWRRLGFRWGGGWRRLWFRRGWCQLRLRRTGRCFLACFCSLSCARPSSGVQPREHGGGDSRRDIRTVCVSSDIWRRFGDWVERPSELCMTIVVDATTSLYTSCATIAPVRAIVTATSLHHVTLPRTTSTTPNRAVLIRLTSNCAFLPYTTYLFNMSCTRGLRLFSYSGTPQTYSHGLGISYKHTRCRCGRCRRRNSTHVIHAIFSCSPSFSYPFICVGVGVQRFSFAICAVRP